MLDKLRVFALLAQLRNERETARAMHMTQPSVSATVRKLEEVWGSPLLISRGRRGIELTDAGQLVYEFAVKVLELAAQTRKALLQVQQGQRGQVTVSLNPRAVYLLPGVLHQFQQQYPHVGVEIRSCLTHEVQAEVRDGISDLGVTWEPVSKQDFRVDTLGWEPFDFYAGKGHPLAATTGHPLELEVVARYQFLVDLMVSSTTQFLKALMIARGIDTFRLAEVGNHLTSKEMVMAGMGVGFCARSTIQREMWEDRLVRLQVKGVEPQRQLVVISRPGANVDVAVDTLRSYVLRRLAGKLNPARLDAQAVLAQNMA